MTEPTFNSLVGDLDYPMFIVTASAGGERSGCLIGFATHASIDPSRFLVCLSHKNRTYRVAQGAELLGGETGDDVDKFERVGWEPGPGGTPLLDACPNRFVSRCWQRGTDSEEFSFHRAKQIEPGHEA